MEENKFDKCLEIKHKVMKLKLKVEEKWLDNIGNREICCILYR